MGALLLAGSVLLLAVAGGAIAYLFSAGARTSQKRLSSIAVQDVPDQSPAPKTDWPGVRDRAPIITSLLRRTEFQNALQLEILRAGWLLRPSELIALIAGAGMLGALIGLAASQRWPVAILGAGIGAVIPWMMLKTRQSSRAKSLNAQLPEAMDMLASALRSGFSFLRGLQLIASQMHPPISEEFSQVIEEVQFGASVSEALDNLIGRTKDYDLELVVSAVQTQLEIGGNLAEILDNIGGMIRERVKLSGEIAAATTEGRMSAGILLALPFGVAFLMSITNPGYMDPLFTTRLGNILLVIGGGLMGLGAIVIKKLVTIDI